MSWSTLLGHQRQIDGFRQIVARQRLAHAYLFVGPSGNRAASAGFLITAIGYVTDREVTTGNFTFNGSNLGTTSLAIPVDPIFSVWLGGSQPPSTIFGSQFTYTQQFNVNGSNTSIASVSLTLTNKVGTSNSLSANLN